MAYRLNLYRGSKLTSTELVETSLEEAKELAIAAIVKGQVDRVELVGDAGATVFQRWAVL